MTVHQLSADKASSGTPRNRDVARPLAGLSAIAGLGAVAAASCCVLPLALAGLGVGSVVLGGLGALTAYQPLILGVAVALLAGAWIAYWRRERANACAADGICARPETSRVTLIALAIATLAVVAGAGWVFVEPVLRDAIL